MPKRRSQKITQRKKKKKSWLAFFFILILAIVVGIPIYNHFNSDKSNTSQIASLDSPGSFQASQPLVNITLETCNIPIFNEQVDDFYVASATYTCGDPGRFKGTIAFNNSCGTPNGVIAEAWENCRKRYTGKITCNSRNKCPNNVRCINGECETYSDSCTLQRDCPRGFTCTSGRCRANPVFTPQPTSSGWDGGNPNPTLYAPANLPAPKCASHAPNQFFTGTWCESNTACFDVYCNAKGEYYEPRKVSSCSHCATWTCASIGKKANEFVAGTYRDPSSGKMFDYYCTSDGKRVYKNYLPSFPSF